MPALQVRQEAFVVVKAEAVFAFKDLWWGDGVSGLLPPGGAQLGQDGIIGIGNGGLAVGGQLAVVEVDDGFSRPDVAGGVVLDAERGVGLRQGVLQGQTHRDLSKQCLTSGAPEHAATANGLGGQNEVDAAGAEQPGTFDDEIAGGRGDGVLVGKEHLELVDDHYDAGHDGLRISQAVLTDVLYAGCLEGGHALAVDGEEVAQDVDAVLPIGVKPQHASVRQEGTSVRVWGEGLEGDAFLEVEHVELDLAGGVALAQGVHHHRDEVGLALPDRAGDQGVVALVELIAEGDLDGGHPIGAHCKADAVPTGLRPGSIQRLHLAEGHWLDLGVGDRRGDVSAN